jgi:hypothetical protein
MSETWLYDDVHDPDDPLTALRIPVVANAVPRRSYIVALDSDPACDRPTDAEAALLRSFLDHYISCYYTPYGRRRLAERPFDVDDGAHGYVFRKFGPHARRLRTPGLRRIRADARRLPLVAHGAPRPDLPAFDAWRQMRAGRRPPWPMLDRRVLLRRMWAVPARAPRPLGRRRRRLLLVRAHPEGREGGISTNGQGVSMRRQDSQNEPNKEGP